MNTPIKSPSSNLQENPSLRTTAPAQTKKKLPMKYIIGGIVALLLLIGGIIAFYLMNQNADTRQQAAGCTATQVQCTCGCKEKAIWIKTAGGCSGLCGSTGGSTPPPAGGGVGGSACNSCLASAPAATKCTSCKSACGGTVPGCGPSPVPTPAQTCTAGIVKWEGCCGSGKTLAVVRRTDCQTSTECRDTPGQCQTPSQSPTQTTCIGGCQVGSCSTVDQQTATGICANGGFCCKPKGTTTPTDASCIAAGGACQAGPCGPSRVPAGGTCTGGKYCCKAATSGPIAGSTCTPGQIQCGASGGCAEGQGRTCGSYGAVTSPNTWSGCQPVDQCRGQNAQFLAPGTFCGDETGKCSQCQYGATDFKCNSAPTATQIIAPKTNCGDVSTCLARCQYGYTTWFPMGNFCNDPPAGSGTTTSTNPTNVTVTNTTTAGPLGSTDTTVTYLPQGSACSGSSCLRCAYGTTTGNLYGACNYAPGGGNAGYTGGQECGSADVCKDACKYGYKKNAGNGYTCLTEAESNATYTSSCAYNGGTCQTSCYDGTQTKISGVCSTGVCCKLKAITDTSAATSAACTQCLDQYKSYSVNARCDYCYTKCGPQAAGCSTSKGGASTPTTTQTTTTTNTTTTSGGGGGTSTPPVQSGPACVGMTMDGTGALNTAVTFTCANVTGAARYEFRVRLPSGTFQTLTATGNKSASFTIATPGEYKAQCRSCTGAAASTCHAYETIGGGV